MPTVLQFLAVMQMKDCKDGTQVPVGLLALEELVADDSQLLLLKDLLHQLLQVDASHRPSASQALAHAYFAADWISGCESLNCLHDNIWQSL